MTYAASVLTLTSLVASAAMAAGMCRAAPGCDAEPILSKVDLASVSKESDRADLEEVVKNPFKELRCGTPAPASRPVDLAICLDTSGSMQSLIESAKQKIWAVVNDLAIAKPTPDLRVAILTYGNDGYSAENGWVRIDVPLTNDLDVISEKLFSFSTNGGTELVGRVVDSALQQLDWHSSEDALKLIVVAGNETADQDREINFLDAASRSIGSGIAINAIYCGTPTDAIAPSWRALASHAEGHFAAIDKDNGTVIVQTPFDVRLGTLSVEINATYIPYGQKGATSCWNQTAQDANAESLGQAAAAQRAATKASALYECSTWDLVDASNGAEFDLEKIATEALPEKMRSMSAKERTSYVEDMAKRRASIKTEIAELTTKRAEWVQNEMTRSNLDDSSSFDAALRAAIRAQAVAKGFHFSGTGPTASSE